jgi:hypothetical protein
MVALVALLTAGMAYGQSQVKYALELGGDNHTDQWEAAQAPTFTSGVTDNTKTVGQNSSITWAVRVTVSGTHSGTPGDNKPAIGAANLVFDLGLYDNAGNLVQVGAAPMACSVGTPGAAGAKTCAPTGTGFWSSINDGDYDGARGAANIPDIWANAALAIAIIDGGYDSAPSPQRYTLKDAPTVDAGGPRFDYGWYPTANGRGGVSFDGGTPAAVNNTNINGMLVGFGAGYKSYSFFDATTNPTGYLPGVGVYQIGDIFGPMGFGADPGDGSVAEKPLFEGQIYTGDLPAGTYTLKLLPSADGTNILHGDVVYDSTTPNYGGAGSFAAKANTVVAVPADGLKFTVVAAPVNPTLTARKIFYNQSWYDGNKIGIDAAPIAGANNDDADAIDTSKEPLMLGGGIAQFKNWTGYDKGINGLIYDVHNAKLADLPTAADFVFKNIGKTGTVAPVVVTPSAFSVLTVTDLGGGYADVRVIVTFANAALKSTWLQVDVSTGFGLAAAETHFWGNCAGDTGTGNVSPNILVNPTDEINARNNPKTPGVPATVDFPYDINKDRLVNPTDQIYIRSNPLTPGTAVKMITK